MLSKTFPDASVVWTINEVVVAVVGGFVNPFTLICINKAFTAEPNTAVITLPEPVQVTAIPLGSTYSKMILPKNIATNLENLNNIKFSYQCSR